LTPAARQMMIDGLPFATRESNGKLHPFQSQFLAIVNDTLVELKQDAERRQGEHKNKLELLEKQVEESRAAREEAMKNVENTTQLVQEKASELKECEQISQEIEKEHEQMLKIKNEEDERRAELDTSKVEVTSILEGPFHLLLEGKCGEGEPITVAVKAVDTFLRHIGTEPALVAAAVRALAVTPASRRDFDALTISCVKQTLETRLNEANTLLDDHQSKYRSVAAEQLGLWALLDQEKSHVAAARAVLVDAEVSLVKAQDLWSSAGKEVKAKSDAVSQQLCERVILDDMVKEIAGATEAAARLAAFNYEAITLAAVAPDASVPNASAADIAGSMDVSMAAPNS